MNKEQHEKEDHEELETVFVTGNQAIVVVVKSILDEAKIRYLAKGDGVQDTFGYGIIGTYNPVTGPIMFQVMPEDATYARELLKDIVDN